MSKTILITGGAGFIGSHIADALVARGDEVVAIAEHRQPSPLARFCQQGCQRWCACAKEKG